MLRSPKQNIKFLLGQLKTLLRDSRSGRELGATTDYWQLPLIGLQNMQDFCLDRMNTVSDFIHSRRWLAGSVALTVALLCTVLFFQPEEKFVEVLEPPLTPQAIAQHNARIGFTNDETGTTRDVAETDSDGLLPSAEQPVATQQNSNEPFFAPSLIRDPMNERHNAGTSPMFVSGSSSSQGAWLTGGIEEVEDGSPISRTGLRSNPSFPTRR